MYPYPAPYKKLNPIPINSGLARAASSPLVSSGEDAREPLGAVAVVVEGMASDHTRAEVQETLSRLATLETSVIYTLLRSKRV